MTRESGSWKGRSFIQGGQAPGASAALHACADGNRAQTRSRAELRDPCGQGEPAKAALTAVMHKLLVVANAFVQQDLDGVRAWTPRMSTMHPTGG